MCRPHQAPFVGNIVEFSPEAPLNSNRLLISAAGVSAMLIPVKTLVLLTTVMVLALALQQGLSGNKIRQLVSGQKVRLPTLFGVEIPLNPRRIS